MFTLKKIFPGLPETERGRPFVLKSDPKGQKLIYGIANSIIVRDVNNPAIAELITHHAKKVSSTCYAPSGFYVCSGDITGTIKIWDTVNEEHAVKYEFKPLAGTIWDIGWSDDSKRLVFAGDGREKYASVISWDSGTTIGTMTGHTKTALSVDYKQTRPYGIVTAGEDMNIISYKGPPFKYEKTIREHTNFVNCVRYNPDGSLVASAGMDGKIFIFDGKTMDLKHELMADGTDRAHNGGVYAVSWSPCGQKLMSVSGDKTCKIWNVLEKKCETKIDMGSDVMDQQLGCIWMKEHMATLALSGKITFLSPSDPSGPQRYFWGHNKGIVSADITSDKKVIITGSYEGVLNHWDIETGNCVNFAGNKFSNQVTAISIKEDLLTAVGVGKIVKFASISKKEFMNQTVMTESDPLSVIMVSNSDVVVGAIKSIDLIRDMKKIDSVELGYESLSVNVCGCHSKIIVCGSDKKIHFFSITGDKLVADTNEINIGEPLTKVAVSHCGKKMLVATANKIVHLYNIETLNEERSWPAQTNRVNNIDFSHDDQHVVTCGVDGAVNIYKTNDSHFRIEIRLAHRMYNCSSAMWCGEKSIVTIGQQDCTIKFWDLKI